MSERRSRRKLAAILSADVVGYSRLMAADEAATVETLKSYRHIVGRLVARHGGRVVHVEADERRPQHGGAEPPPGRTDGLKGDRFQRHAGRGLLLSRDG